jgi:hypothetical protein
MLIKIIKFDRLAPRTRNDLRRLLRYLFEPKMLDKSGDDRLLGPPELHHLTTSWRPWGSEAKQAATDLAIQFEVYCKEACIGKQMPFDWYAHLLFSFAPQSSDDLRSPADPHMSPMRKLSQSKNAIRIAKDVMDNMGWYDTQPTLFVCHGDKAHIHVHVVVSTLVYDDFPWEITKYAAFEEQAQLFEWASIGADVFKLDVSTPRLKAYYKKWTAAATPIGDHG